MKMKARRATFDDSDFILEVRNDERTRENSFETGIVPEAVHRKWLQAFLDNENATLLIIEGLRNGNEVPIAYFQIDQDDEISFALHPSYQGQGLGVYMVQAGLKYITENFPNRTVHALVLPHNKPSQSLMIKSGFSDEGITTVKGQPCHKYVLPS